MAVCTSIGNVTFTGSILRCSLPWGGEGQRELSTAIIPSFVVADIKAFVDHYKQQTLHPMIKLDEEISRDHLGGIPDAPAGQGPCLVKGHRSGPILERYKRRIPGFTRLMVTVPTYPVSMNIRRCFHSDQAVSMAPSVWYSDRIAGLYEELSLHPWPPPHEKGPHLSAWPILLGSVGS